MILGNERQIRYLDRVMARGRLAHAYLFYGPDEAGMLAVAKAIAKMLCCTSVRSSTPNSYVGGDVLVANAGDGCRECAAIDAGAHYDVILLDLAHSLAPVKEKRKEIPIDDIRELKRRFSLSAPGEHWRIAIINQADTMSSEAANAFLKLLEEPGERTLFILITSARDLIAPTIASRAVPIRFAAAADSGDEKMRLAVEKALERGIPETLAFAEKVISDAAMRSRAIHAVIGFLRAKLHSAAPADRLRLGRHISRALELAEIIETTNVNSRLALDVMLLESRDHFL